MMKYVNMMHTLIGELKAPLLKESAATNSYLCTSAYIFFGARVCV